MTNRPTAQVDPYRERIADALYQAKHYHELAEDALNSGDVGSAESWLKVLCEEVDEALQDGDD